MAAEDLESIEATLELLADPAAQQRIAQSQQEGLPEAVACACYEFIRGPLAEERRRGWRTWAAGSIVGDPAAVRLGR